MWPHHKQQYLTEMDNVNGNLTPSIFCLELPINKVQVGFAPSPNLKAVQPKVGSLANASYKPSGGNVKIESRKIHIDAKPRVGARNDSYTPSGGDVKVVVVFFFLLRSISLHDENIPLAMWFTILLVASAICA